MNSHLLQMCNTDTSWVRTEHIDIVHHTTFETLNKRNHSKSFRSLSRIILFHGFDINNLHFEKIALVTLGDMR